MSTIIPRSVCLFLVCIGSVSSLAYAQGPPDWDIRLLESVYHTPSPVLQVTFRAADRTAYPAFYAGPVVAWGISLASGASWQVPYRFTLAHVSAVGGTMLLKRLLKRPRPYALLPEIRARRSSDIVGVKVKDPYAFPSGHTAVAFAMITSLSLSHPQWYVMAPGYAWAAAIGMSRIWLGLHYPSDVLGGVLLGAAASVGIHLLRHAITP